MGYTALIPIIVICVLANHMGLIYAIERQTRTKLPVINCCKCSTFWFTAIYLIVTRHDVILSLALSFSAAYFAVWLELVFGIIDRQYEHIYEKFFTNNTEVNTRAENTSGSEKGVS